MRRVYREGLGGRDCHSRRLEPLLVLGGFFFKLLHALCHLVVLLGLLAVVLGLGPRLHG